MKLYDKYANATNTISTNVTSTVPINSNHKKVKYEMDCYVLQTFLLANIELFMIAIVCNHYAKHRSKQKSIGSLTIQKCKSNNNNKILW